MISSVVMLIVLSLWCSFASYQALRHSRLYWSYPTFVGFKDRKEPSELRWLCKVAGIIAGLLSAFFVFLATRGFIDWL